MLGLGLFAIGTAVGLIALGRLVFLGVGTRAMWTIVQTCLIVGSVFFATGLIGEQIAVQRSEVRELRRRFEEKAAQHND